MKMFMLAVVLSLLVFTGVGVFSAQPSASASGPKPPSLPVTGNPYTLLGFDRRSPPKDFTLVHRAYRALARQYHPDVVAGPDATSEERAQASVDFTRIKEAYEDLKARQDEEEFEMVLMGGNFATGKRDRRVKYKTSEKMRQQDPNRVSTRIFHRLCVAANPKTPRYNIPDKL